MDLMARLAGSGGTSAALARERSAERPADEDDDVPLALRILAKNDAAPPPPKLPVAADAGAAAGGSSRNEVKAPSRMQQRKAKNVKALAGSTVRVRDGEQWFSGVIGNLQGGKAHIIYDGEGSGDFVLPSSDVLIESVCKMLKC